MAGRQGIAVSSSRFAVLKIEDDEEEVETKSKQSNQNKGTPQQQTSSNNASKKKNKKKKQDQKDKDQLKQLAFGKSGAPNVKPKVQTQNGSGDGSGRDNSWNEWKEHDAELMEEQFKDDLAKALLESRLEVEQKKQEAEKKKERIEAGIEEPTTREGRKKKKQKEKPQPMSLEQFKQLPKEKVKHSDDSDEEINGLIPEPAPQARVPANQHDPQFFNSVDDDAEQILRQEKMQAEYRKQYASDNAVVARLKSDLADKDLKISELTSTVKKLEEELKEVKKRNKQFCVILAQGEMKDKAQVLLQVDELTVIKDELTEQVTALTAEVEKEKSKNHALKSELDKLKTSKHGK